MSRPLAISAAFSVLAMAAFALAATPAAGNRSLGMQTGAAAHATAPALGQVLPALSSLIG